MDVTVRVENTNMSEILRDIVLNPWLPPGFTVDSVPVIERLAPGNPWSSPILSRSTSTAVWSESYVYANRTSLHATVGSREFVANLIIYQTDWYLSEHHANHANESGPRPPSRRLESAR